MDPPGDNGVHSLAGSLQHSLQFDTCDLDLVRRVVAVPRRRLLARQLMQGPRRWNPHVLLYRFLEHRLRGSMQSRLSTVRPVASGCGRVGEVPRFDFALATDQWLPTLYARHIGSLASSNLTGQHQGTIGITSCTREEKHHAELIPPPSPSRRDRHRRSGRDPVDTAPSWRVCFMSLSVLFPMPLLVLVSSPRSRLWLPQRHADRRATIGTRQVCGTRMPFACSSPR